MEPITLNQMQRVCRLTPAARLVEILPPLVASFDLAQISTPLRAAHYLSQVTHESMGFTRLEENLNYSAAGLRAMWPKHFQTDAIAQDYAHQPERIANRAYADRLGNGDEESGEGWKFRGRGGLQQTGEESYLRFTRETGINVLALPDLLADPQHAFLGAAKVWTWKGLNVFADKNDIIEITHRISGGQTGLPDRQSLFKSYCAELGIAVV